MAVTLKDIAAAAGVSIGTVERALKNKDRIKPEVAERIRALAKEMNYRPNTVASGLVNRSKKNKIAVILNIRNDFWETVIHGIKRAEKEIRDYGIELAFYFGNGFREETQLALIDQALEEKANALILVPLNSEAVAQRIRSLLDQSFPIVFLNTYINDLQVLSSIHCDYYRTGRIAGALIDRFTRTPDRVLAILPSSQVLGNNERKAGIRDHFLESVSMQQPPCYLETTNHIEEDIANIRRLLEENPDIHNIIFNGDTRILLDAVKDIVREMTIVTFDLSEGSRNALLSGSIDAIVGQSQEDQGYNAVQVLFQYLTSGKHPKNVIIKTSEIYIKECLD